MELPDPLIRAVIEGSSSMILIVLSRDGEILESNQACAAQLKHPLGELLGESVWPMLTDTDAERLRRTIEELGDGAAQSLSLNFVDADHFPLTFDCWLSLDGESSFLVGEQRAAEATGSAAFLQLNNELATISREHARTSKNLDAALRELRESHWHLKKIQEVLPICLSCGKVKTESEGWHDVVDFLKRNSMFLSHGYCPSCFEQWMSENGFTDEAREGEREI